MATCNSLANESLLNESLHMRIARKGTNSSNCDQARRTVLVASFSLPLPPFHRSFVRTERSKASWDCFESYVEL